MVRVVEAIYEDGVLKPLEKLDLAERQHVRVTVQPNEEPGGDEKAHEDATADPLAGLRVRTGISDLAERFDDYRFGRRRP